MTLAPMASRTALKPPPENPEAEASLLGAILIDGNVYAETVHGRLAPPDLSRDNHRLVLGAIERVAERAESIGFQSVQAELAARDELEAAGGPQFLVGLMQFVPTVAHASTYADIVERTSTLRRLITAANEIARLALTRDTAVQAVREAQELLFALSERSLHRDILSLRVALQLFAEQIMARGEDQKIGIPTGFKTLDEKTGGLQQSDLIVLAGRPGLGKTSLALNIAAHAALTEKKTVALFSMEMSELQVVQRLISMEAGIDGNRMRHGRLTQPEFAQISQASSRLQAAPVFVEESSRLNTTDILAKSRRLQAEHGLDLVIIDYLQLIEGADDDENRVQEIAQISRSLKLIARELQIPVIALSQLSRQIETRGTEPMLSDLRDGGSIEQDADLVLFLWQKDQNDRKDGIIRLKLAKHRNGPTADIDLHFMSSLTRFSDLGETNAEPRA
ncbi:MAG: replicative DNA helicase [Candidatus Limnocylindria bacterium]|nr:replicative DNA helicase [Candidatus Limnocylindria bacterium]